mgnify:CR=1 FL=1
MSTIAFDQFALTRIADFARSLSRLHQTSRRQPVDDDAIEQQFEIETQHALIGGSGADTLEGGSGYDSFTFADGDSGTGAGATGTVGRRGVTRPEAMTPIPIP